MKMVSDQSVSTVSTAATSTVSVSKALPKKIFVAISPETTQASLWFEITQICRVKDVHVPQSQYNRENHRGFAFITFFTNEDAAKGLNQLNGKSLDGLILRPRWAHDNKNTDKKQPKKEKRNGSQKRRDRKKKEETVARMNYRP